MSATAALGDGARLLRTMGEARYRALGNAPRPGAAPIDILADESHDSAFLALNPTARFPQSTTRGACGTPLALFEAGEILLYLADKTAQFFSTDPNTRYENDPVDHEADGWSRAIFGQVGFFNKSAGKGL